MTEELEPLLLGILERSMRSIIKNHLIECKVSEDDIARYDQMDVATAYSVMALIYGEPNLPGFKKNAVT